MSDNTRSYSGVIFDFLSTLKSCFFCGISYQHINARYDVHACLLLRQLKEKQKAKCKSFAVPSINMPEYFFVVNKTMFYLGFATILSSVVITVAG